MIPFDPLGSEFLYLAAVAAAGGILRGFTGFGSAMLMSPLWALAIGPIETLLTLMILEAAVTLQLLPRALRSTDWRLVGWLTVAAAVAMPVGLYVLVSADPTLIRRAIGVVVLAWALVMLSGVRYRGRLTTSATLGIGAVSGMLMGATSLGGPPVLMYLLSSTAPAEQNRANIITYFGLVTLYLIAVLIYKGMYDAETLWRAGLLTPLFLAGAWLGASWFDRSSEATFRRVALVFLLAVGLFTAGGWDLLRLAFGTPG